MPNELAYGFVKLEQVLANRVDDVGFQVVRTAIEDSVAEYQRVTNALLDMFLTRTTQAQYRYYLPGANVDMQPMDQWGNPIPVQTTFTSYDVGLPIWGAGTAWGTNRVARAMQTVQEANNHVVNALRADARWIRRHMLAAMFDNVNWTFEDKELGSLAVKALANGDAVTYRLTNNSVTTDNHYLAQAAAIADAANPFPAIRTELLEHPENAGSTVVVYIPSNLVDSVTALTAFMETEIDPDIEFVNVDRLTTDGERFRAFGDRVLGKVSQVWIVEWTGLPDNYMLAVAFGSTDSTVAMREYEVASLRGIISESYTPDGARFENRILRYAGFGVQNRIGAAIMRIGNASYAIPTGYDAPLAS